MGVSELIAEVNTGRFPGVDEQALSAIADKAAQSEGTERLIVLRDPATDEICSIHIWRDRSAFEANANRRDELISEAEGVGGQLAEGARVYEVVRQ